MRDKDSHPYRIPVGQLRFAASGELYVLGPRCLLGRGPRCDLRVDDPRVSSEHAVVHHNGQRWELKDLGSRNGTFVGRKRMAPGDRQVLAQGMSFTLGSRGVTFELVDASPPAATAQRSVTGERRTASNGILALPDDVAPVVTIFPGLEGKWVEESVDGEREVKNGDAIVVAGEEWRLELPDFGASTLDTARFGPTIDTITLRFTVSRDEERVDVTVVHDGIETPLGPRSYHYLLLTLARARLADAGAPPAERGWVERERLCRMLGIDVSRLNVDIYRARRQLGGLGIHGATQLVARRQDTGHIRLGIQQVEVVSAWEGSTDAPPAQP